MNRHFQTGIAFALLLTLSGLIQTSGHAADGIELKPGDNISYIGNTLATRMQHHAWLETYLHAAYPKHNLTFRNLSFPGDELVKRPRSANFGSPDQWLTKNETDVIFGFFGYNEAMRGEAGLEQFKKELATTIDDMKAQKYNGESAPRIVMFSPIAHENLNSPNLPDGTENNKNLKLYTDIMYEVCKEKDIPFVDLFSATQALYAKADKPLTLNGVHLLDHGNQAVAQVVMKDVFGKQVADNPKLHESVLDKNYHWFSRYRVVDGYNVYGGRSKLNWFGQSNADVMMREMEIFDVMTANRDEKIWAIAQGNDLAVKDDNLPDQIPVKTNKPGQLEGDMHPYLSGQDGISKMKIAEGMQVNLFASEEMFPELINPVQMAVDTDGRLFASVWPSYPHWNPTKPRTDRIVCLPDEDGDGVADKCTIFADELNSITGFEFWSGGMLVSSPPEIWFLKDTDGDDKADVKIRMLQGVSSADSHHTANAIVIGPDGWLYWSRGVFHVTNMETPTKTYRSTSSGVHRFNPRTFEMEFHFPIGPNPHGDVFDQWGYHFVNDGTGGTGSYANIGKGIGNKKWFEKRVRPVAATGILSSPNFPKANQGNFLICNTIGFLGVLQHEVKYNGADITAEEVEPVLVSTDPNFRPTDVEIGGDGALYVSDWCNVLIGHMQHNIRDPNRDAAHGRIYRVTAKGGKVLKPAKMKGKPVAEVCENFFTPANAVRYRARLELSGRESESVTQEVAQWAAKLNPANDSTDRNEAQALLECLWVFEEHRIVNMELLNKVFQAKDPRIRSAAIRTLGHWGTRASNWEAPLLAAARDTEGLVRAEAVKAAVSFEGLAAAEAVFEVANQPTDPELDFVLKYATSQLKVDTIVKEAIASGKKLSTAAQLYVLRNASVDDLLKLERTAAVYQAILSRKGVSLNHLRDSLSGLAEMQKVNKLNLLLDLFEGGDARGETHNLSSFGQLLTEYSADQLSTVSNRIEELALSGKNDSTRRVAYVAWIVALGSPDDAYLAAVQSKDRLREFLSAVPEITDAKLRAQLYSKVQPLIFEMPSGLKAEAGGSSSHQPGIQVEYYYPSGSNVAVETLDKMTPKATGVVPEIVMNVPQRKQADTFALRFTGNVIVPKAGKYTFFVSSDDGSRIYLDGKLFVNNDGLHGMIEKSASANLTAGAHQLVVTYFDNGGGDGLKVSWQGPGIKKQSIAADRLTISGGETLHDTAIRSLASIPSHEDEKFLDLASLVKAGKNRTSAIATMRSIPDNAWAQKEIQPLIDNLVGYLSQTPAQFRTGGPALDAIAFTEALTKKLPKAKQAAVLERLKNLDVPVIAIGTVPHRMIYDKELIAIQAGKPVEFRFSNTDNMPHNFAVVIPGSLEEIGMLAEATARDADAIAREYIPTSPKILVGSKLIQPGDSQAITFEAPTAPGVYPYVCTYPGHWRRMYGALYVVENIEEYNANPEAYLAAHPLEIKDELLTNSTRGRKWTFNDLIAEVKPLPMGRSFEVGKQLFKVSSCIACHKLDNEGLVFGPDLAKLDVKKSDTEHILRSLLEPSKEIDEKFQSYSFLLDSGKVITGMIMKETPDTYEIVINPLAKGKPTVIKKDEIEEQAKSKVSIMPEGLLDKLSREEILDLIAFVFAKGDKKHMLFMGHDHKH